MPYKHIIVQNGGQNKKMFIDENSPVYRPVSPFFSLQNQKSKTEIIF